MQITSHLTEASLAAALERGGGAADEAARAHAMECEPCREALTQARAEELEVGLLFNLLDHSPPEINAAEFVTRLASRAKLRDVVSRRHLWHRNVARWTIAAGMLTAGVAAAAALVPNSPVRRLVNMIVAASPVGAHGESHPAVTEKTAVQSESPRGVEILPHGRTEVVFRSSQTAGAVRVVAATTAQLSVEGDGDGPTYTVGNNAIIVGNRTSDSVSYVVRVPVLTDSDAVYIRIARRVMYSDVGSQATARLTDHTVLPITLVSPPSLPWPTR